jgi:hypothetical protein
MMLHLLADTSMAPYETMLYSLEVGARLLEEIQAAREGGGGTAEGEDETAEMERLLSIIGVPFEQMSDAQMKEAAVREFSDLDRLTEMSYFTSNDWTAVPGASDDELDARGVWVGSVTIRLMLVKEDRVGEIEDPDEDASAALQGRLSSAYQRTQALIWQERERELNEALASAQAANDQERIAEIQEQIPRERTAVLDGRLELAFCDFGESCYVLRLIEASPEDLGIEASAGARLRNGRAVVHFSLEGDFPATESTRVMDHFLSEMDARTNLFFE